MRWPWSPRHSGPQAGAQAASSSDLPEEVKDRQMLNEAVRGRLSLRSGQVGRQHGQPTGAACSPRTTTPRCDSAPWLRSLAGLLLPP